MHKVPILNQNDRKCESHERFSFNYGKLSPQIAIDFVRNFTYQH